MNLSRPDRVERLDGLAAAYVLGTLSGRARVRLAHIARTDTVVRATIRAWEERLAPFAQAAPPIAPSPHVWKRIALRLGLPADRTLDRGPWWARVGFWRGFAVASFVAALGLALALTQLAVAPAGAPIVVVLAAQDQPPALVATMERDSRVMTVKVVGGAPVPPDRSLELWMLPQGAAPRSLGVLPSTGVGRVTLPALPDAALAGVPALAVSLEQRGGSTSGAPQGPVLYTGRVERLY
jgi:anti-sigma-K factor RskA